MSAEVSVKGLVKVPCFESTKDCKTVIQLIESFIAAPSACGGGDSAECACVDCTFTVDNVVNSVKYNDNPLQISGGAVNNWQQEKVISFQSCDDSCPGILEIKGNYNLAQLDLYCKNW